MGTIQNPPPDDLWCVKHARATRGQYYAYRPTREAAIAEAITRSLSLRKHRVNVIWHGVLQGYAHKGVYIPVSHVVNYDALTRATGGDGAP